jgi:AAA+ ATPase superfamily predicted ATPase
MDTPFVFGRTAEEENFTDRVVERQKLSQNFQSLINTAIISPRRWGKSSLVNYVAQELRKQKGNLRICRLDLFNVRSEAGFYKQLASAVVRATSNKVEDWLATAKEFLAHLRPQISFSTDMREEISFDVEWERVQKDPDEILELPERIAQAKKLKLVVCIDEFQAIADFRESLAFQRKLRSHWQNQQHVCYCLYGSKRHMMTRIFADPEMPFYRFGDIMLLPKIPNVDWASFIVGRFQASGKRITPELASYLAEQVDNHSFYVQQLAQQVWLKTTGESSQEIIDESMRGLADQLSLLFANEVDVLSDKQVNFLHALLSGAERLSSQETIKRFDLGTSATVSRTRKLLIEREILDEESGCLTFSDPVFRYWLAHSYF